MRAIDYDKLDLDFWNIECRDMSKVYHSYKEWVREITDEFKYMQIMEGTHCYELTTIKGDEMSIKCFCTMQGALEELAKYES